MNYQFRKAVLSEIPHIWEILEQAILRRKADGSEQWQDGYPNKEVIHKDIEKNAGYVLTKDAAIVGYSAVLVNYEPAYEKIVGQWLTNDEFVAVHRLAISDKYLGKGCAKVILEFIEKFALDHKIYSIKADTNFDNLPMLHIFTKMNYHFCGEVYFRGAARKAFEKVLAKVN